MSSPPLPPRDVLVKYKSSPCMISNDSAPPDRRTSSILLASRWSFGNRSKRAALLDKSDDDDDDTVFYRRNSFGRASQLAEKVYVLEQKRVSTAKYSGSSFEDDVKALRKSLEEGQLQGELKTSDSDITKKDSLDDEASLDKKSVKFSTLSIREYPMVVGNNPGVTKGVPLSLGWDYSKEYSLALDPYERARRDHRRNMQNLAMDSTRRDTILKTLGFSRQERMQGTKIANIIRRQRRETNARRNLDRHDEKMDKLKRGLKKLAR
ncbi:MAG: hypothetical protein SGARI_008280, partial [Bacillariaceae sp.]